MARTQWDRPNSTQTASWTSTLTNKLINEFSFTYSLDEVFIDIYRGHGFLPAKQVRDQLSLHLPADKAIPDRIPTITVDGFTEIDGSPYPSSSRGPIYTFNEAATYLKGRHTFKTGVMFEYSGEDDFDQINVSAVGDFTNNQNGRFTFRNARQITGTGIGQLPLWGCSRAMLRSAAAH